MLATAIAEYTTPTANSNPNHITTGPDGNLWFTENAASASQIGKITPSGQIIEFPTPTARSAPWGITLGPDNNLWFTEQAGNKIGMITPSGQITEFTVPTGASSPLGIVTGPDNNLWFTESAVGKIGMFNPTTHQFNEFPLTSPSSMPTNITVGPDHNLWFTEPPTGRIGRITTTGAITEFQYASTSTDPVGIVAGPDNNLWVTEQAPGTIAKVDTSGHLLADYDLTALTPNPLPDGITVGPDNNLYFAEMGGMKIGQITTSGQITEFPITTPNSNSAPVWVTTGPDHNIWFTDAGANAIGRLALNVPAPTPTPTPTPSPTSNLTRLLNGVLNPAFDTGFSHSDGITSINQPNFFGATVPGFTVLLFAQRSGQASPVQIGEAVAGANGIWSITADQPLADGAYVITATAFGAGGILPVQTAVLLPNSSEGPLFIDTMSPRITNVQIIPATGQIVFQFQDTGAGLDPLSFLNPISYIVSGPNLLPQQVGKKSVVFLGDGLNSPTVVLSLNNGLPLQSGVYHVTIPAFLMSDRAGNYLDGSFFGTFPTGANGLVHGDFQMMFVTNGIAASLPLIPTSTLKGIARYERFLRKHLVSRNV